MLTDDDTTAAAIEADDKKLQFFVTADIDLFATITSVTHGEKYIYH